MAEPPAGAPRPACTTPACVSPGSREAAASSSIVSPTLRRPVPLESVHPAFHDGGMRMTRILRPRAVRLFVVAATLLALAGCKGATDIKTLLDNPAAYEGKTVRIAGTVKDSAGILNYGVFTVDDGTGTIAVVTTVG